MLALATWEATVAVFDDGFGWVFGIAVCRFVAADCGFDCANFRRLILDTAQALPFPVVPLLWSLIWWFAGFMAESKRALGTQPFRAAPLRNFDSCSFEIVGRYLRGRPCVVPRPADAGDASRHVTWQIMTSTLSWGRSACVAAGFLCRETLARQERDARLAMPQWQHAACLIWPVLLGWEHAGAPPCRVGDRLAVHGQWVAPWRREWLSSLTAS